jgi:flavin reductase (DIM6/NTAB) family NADH-FMN oxidoreductase RutF
VIPRPIAWVSTTSADGVDNLAPHSFFTVSCVDPPVIQFTSVGRKDSLRNAVETGELVVCLAPEPLFEEVNASATDFPPDVDEFAAVGLEREPSARVRPPRVASSPVAIECELQDTISFGDSTVVFGRVVLIAIDEAVMTDGRPDSALLQPLARLGGSEWSTLGEVRKISRIKHADWPGHYDRADEVD